jgi:hypothetical protein
MWASTEPLTMDEWQRFILLMAEVEPCLRWAYLDEIGQRMRTDPLWKAVTQLVAEEFRRQALEGYE